MPVPPSPQTEMPICVPEPVLRDDGDPSPRCGLVKHTLRMSGWDVQRERFGLSADHAGLPAVTCSRGTRQFGCGVRHARLRCMKARSSG
jgi:hypothetical protein